MNPTGYGMKYQVEIGDKTYIIELIDDHTLVLDGESISYDFSRGEKTGLVSLILNGRSYQAWIEAGDSHADGSLLSSKVHIAGADYDIRIDDERSLKLKEFAFTSESTEVKGRVVAPMPGLVVKVLVNEGDTVKKETG
jgi:acetyl/propionyl-CoA carboxylase alpha subunit